MNVVQLSGTRDSQANRYTLILIVGSVSMKTDPLSGFSGSRNGFAGFAVSGAAALRFPLVPGLLSLGQGNFTFYLPVLEIEAGGNQGVTTLLRLAHEFAQLPGMHQQFA